MRGDPATDLDLYAALALSLSDGTVDRVALLAAHGLDEERWAIVEDTWHTRLSEADAGDPVEDDGEVPALVTAFADAFARAERARASVLPFDRFVEVTREMRRGVAMQNVLERVGVRLDVFLASQHHWTGRMLEDESLAERFRRGLR